VGTFTVTGPSEANRAPVQPVIDGKPVGRHGYLRVDTTFDVANIGLYTPEINRDANSEAVDSNWCTLNGGSRTWSLAVIGWAAEAWRPWWPDEPMAGAMGLGSATPGGLPVPSPEGTSSQLSLSLDDRVEHAMPVAHAGPDGQYARSRWESALLDKANGAFSTAGRRGGVSACLSTWEKEVRSTLAATAKKAAMTVDVFIPAATIGLFGNPLIVFQSGALLDLPDGRRARVTGIQRIEPSGVVVRCAVLDSRLTRR
jgi:hypothetical protein